jgi:hypothetical protein
VYGIPDSHFCDMPLQWDFSTFLHQELFNIEISSSPMLDSGQNFDEGGTHVWHSRFTFLRDTTSFRVLVKISTRVTW